MKMLDVGTNEIDKNAFYQIQSQERLDHGNWQTGGQVRAENCFLRVRPRGFMDIYITPSFHFLNGRSTTEIV